MSEQHLTECRFDSLGLAPELMQGLEEAGFSRCTPIQAQTLPLTLQGRDVAGQAQTGTGKTAAFLLATFHHLLTHAPAEGRRATQPRALIVAPTRELAIQIHRDAETLGRPTGFRLGLVYGGTGYESQRRTLEEGVDVLIGTPGRLIDYFKQRIFDLKAVQVVVLDEADRMFDLGFIKDIRYLLRRCPPPDQRLGLLFSATLALRVTELAYEHMNNPEQVQIEPEQVTAEQVRQVLYHASNEEKIPLLLGLLNHMDPRRSIVFVNTKRAADRVWGYLEGNGISAAVLSGDVPQRTRQKLLERFQQGELPVLVATDVAARGLHIPGVSHVFNYDLPQDAEDYVHRIGRTARLGAEGDAISFACETYVYSLPEIEQYIGQKIPVEPVDESLLVQPAPPVRPPRRPRSGPGGHAGRKSGDRSGGPRGKGARRPPRRRGGSS
ncbi:MAG TPA: ATP-dependent RNA helicase RhlB [Gammaproteobacteria bacterium]|nr:ATP-dependent RNA helicase RhlB [Gammaproteobacteria bacterium]